MFAYIACTAVNIAVIGHLKRVINTKNIRRMTVENDDPTGTDDIVVLRLKVAIAIRRLYTRPY